MIEIIRAESQKDLASAKRLILDYAAQFDVDMSFQDFDGEMASFPGQYAPPKGAILLAKAKRTPIGVVALRPLEGAGICEMKRMWVVPSCQGKGLGRMLCARLYEEARRLGYTVMRLDTVARAEAANRLYRGEGFREIEAYCYNPEPDVLFFEREL